MKETWNCADKQIETSIIEISKMCAGARINTEIGVFKTKR